MNYIPLNLTIRVGCRMTYETTVPTPILFILRPRFDERHMVRSEKLSFGYGLPAYEFQDSRGNLTHRAMLLPGSNEICHDATVAVSSLPEPQGQGLDPVPISWMPTDLIRYTLPSRYCESDKLRDFAWKNFGQVPHGQLRVQAICDWIHNNIEYRFGSGSPELSATEIIARRYGVCRDFAHCGIALCRAFNLPARYVTGHLPDIGFTDPGTPMDFHAWFEVYLGGSWFNFDARFNVPRTGRVKVAHGLDAVEGALSTIYGEAKLSYYEAWAYQIDPMKVSVGDPIDLSKRMDGTTTVRLT